MDVSSLFTVLSGVTGLVGVGLAAWSKLDSKRANEIAQRSEQKAVESLAVAKESNSIAVDARELAEEANAISSRAEARDTEVNNVSWKDDWVDPSTCRLTNTGQDKALNVVATVVVDGEHLTHPTVDLAPGEDIRISLPELLEKLRRNKAEFDAEQQAYRARQAKLAATGLGPSFSVGIAPIHFPLKFDVTVTIQWRTPLGKQLERIIEHPDCVMSLV
ncbi:hypothetical protein HMPREF2808_10930 [Corynebacterium sp. HMSC078A10]|nr:hypothetical protein HMPREF2808_10930 [Corynebacterium sp. HMSC078A10]